MNFQLSRLRNRYVQIIIANSPFLHLYRKNYIAIRTNTFQIRGRSRGGIRSVYHTSPDFLINSKSLSNRLKKGCDDR